MFNSINVICILILKKESLEVVKMFEKLCDLLCYSLYIDLFEKVIIKEEIGIFSNYLDIEKCWFIDKLVVDIFVVDGCNELLIFFMLI